MKYYNLDGVQARIENQLRIHWKWLKNQPHEEVAEFINALVRSGQHKENYEK